MNDHTRAVPAQVARLGEYFALSAAAGGGWHPVADLLEPATLHERAAATRHAIAGFSGADPADVPLRVAASSLQMAIASRLISPALGSVVAVGRVPLLTPAAVRWRSAGHSVQFGAVDLQWRRVDGPADAAALIAETLLDGVLAPLTDRMHRTLALSPQVMWGNAMSAANGAVTVLGMTDRSLVAAGRRLITSLARTAPLRDTAVTDAGNFRRRSCCLFYQAPHGGLCGDCVLQGAPPSH